MQPKIFHATDHDIDPILIDSDAIYVINKLKEAGFLAYLVGGSVRDLLLKKKPKDFDISTSARPEQIKHIFQRNCLLIGRRFRLAHLRFGHKILEVSTFRSGENDSDLIVQDNCWGTPEEDVLRRDFTMNGLYYDPANHIVLDYVGGWQDIHKHILRTIGDPITRFRQDPVRMLRLLKFRARFGFEIDSSTLQALSRCHHEIVKSSPARILEEILRMLESGASEPFFRLLFQTGFLDLLFPCLHLFLDAESGDEIYRYLAAADSINLNEKKPLDRSILAACLLYPIIEKEIETKYLKENIIPHFGQILTLTASLIHSVLTSSFSHFPRRLSIGMTFILSTQYRLTPLAGRRHHRPKLLNNKEFIFALKFLKIRALSNESLTDVHSWWLQHYRQNERQGERKGHLPHPPPRHQNEHLIHQELSDNDEDSTDNDEEPLINNES